MPDTPKTRPARAARQPPHTCWAHWREWKRRCALDLCTDDTRAALRAFAAARIRRFLVRAGAEPDLPAGEAWHLLETWMALGDARRDKRYKDWLLARPRPGRPGTADLADVESGATVLLRTAARQHLSREARPPGTVSLDEPVPGREREGLTLLDLLRAGDDPAAESERRDLEALAAGHAERFDARLNRRQRVALLARLLGLPLSHPHVLRAADCSRGTLATALRAGAGKVLTGVRRAHPAEDQEVMRRLTALTFADLGRRLVGWAHHHRVFARCLAAAREPARS